jgi:hypothetical protein
MDGNTPIRFEIFAGHQIVRTEILMGATLKIGKLNSHSLKLDDPSVSRLHAELEVRNPNEVILKDLGSDQGTFLNNEPVMRAKVFTGDRVRFGEIDCIVSIAGQTSRRPGNPQASATSSTQAQASHVSRSSLPDFSAEVDRGYGKVLQVLGLYGTSVISYGHIHETEPGEFTIGFGVNADCVINPNSISAPEPFPLAEVTESGAMLVHIPDNVNGEVMLDGKIFDLDGLRSAGRMTRGRVPNSSTLALPLRARCRLTIGDFNFLIAAIPHPGYPTPLALADRVDPPLVASIGAVALFMVLVFALISLIPQSPESLDLDRLEALNRFIEITLEAEEKIEEKKNGEDGAKKAANDEGQMGKKESLETNKKYQVKGIDTGDPEVIAARKQAIAQSTVEEIFSAMDSGLLDGNQSAVALGALEGFSGNQTGEMAGNAFGVGGLGGVGTGMGGGGDGVGSFGLGGLSTVGGGGGGRGGRGYGSGAANVGKKRVRKPRIIPLAAKVDGGNLPKEVIKRVIMSRAGAYQNCYERQLQVKRDLNGKIEMLIKISGKGKVILSKVANSTMNNPRVENCIRSNIQKLRFPAPKNGKMVIVRYPFRFKSGG